MKECVQYRMEQLVRCRFSIYIQIDGYSKFTIRIMLSLRFTRDDVSLYHNEPSGHDTVEMKTRNL